MSATTWHLFEETPRPRPLPPFPFPNYHPFGVRWRDSNGPPVPVGEGPLTTYHDSPIPVPGEPNAPPIWTPVSPLKEAFLKSPSAPCTDPSSLPVSPLKETSLTASNVPCPDAPSLPPSPDVNPSFQKPQQSYLSRKARNLPPLQYSTCKVANQASDLLPDGLPPPRRKKNAIFDSQL